MNRHSNSLSVATVTRALVPAIAMLALPAACVAASPNEASLSGTYVFHILTVKEVYWYNTKVCHYATGDYTYGGGGQAADGYVINGEATFNGKGDVSIKAVTLNKFNPTASNNTVTFGVCPAKIGEPMSITDGSMVTENEPAITVAATYTVNSDGSGTITLPDGQGSLSMNLSAFNSSGISTTVLLLNPNNSTSVGEGIGIHE